MVSASDDPCNLQLMGLVEPPVHQLSGLGRARSMVNFGCRPGFDFEAITALPPGPDPLEFVGSDHLS